MIGALDRRPGLVDSYSAMVVRLTQRFYSRVTRYGTGGFLKAKLEGRISD
jgi:propionate CoA-transferase